MPGKSRPRRDLPFGIASRPRNAVSADGQISLPNKKKKHPTSTNKEKDQKEEDQVDTRQPGGTKLAYWVLLVIVLLSTKLTTRHPGGTKLAYWVLLVIVLPS